MNLGEENQDSGSVKVQFKQVFSQRDLQYYTPMLRLFLKKDSDCLHNYQIMI